MLRYLPTIPAMICLTCLNLINLACNPGEKRSVNNVNISQEELSELQKAELEALINQRLEQRDENGNIQDLEGFTKAAELDSDNNLLTDESFRGLSQSEEQIFEFIPPEGVEAEFSEPVMINGAALFLTNADLKTKCEGLAYQAEEPTMKEIIEHSQKNNICGDVKVNFCIRLKLSQQINPESPNYTYTESPSLNLNLPCPGDSFIDLSIAIADGKSHTSNSTEQIKINAFRSVLSVYLTNSPGCLDGGDWQDISQEDPTWNLDFVDKTATVYAKFRDVFDAESTCISDTIGYGSTTEQCFATDTDYLAENILAGVTIGTIEGTASLDYPVCSSDGQLGCIATSNYKADNASGLANKILVGQTAGGIEGSIPIETHSDCSSGNQEDCITTATYRSMDLSSKDAGGAVDITNALFSARIKSSSTFEYWDETGTRYTAAGDADIVEANLVDGAEVFGITGNAGGTPDCSSITVGGTWILIPGDTDYGTNDFCVMKYEVKCSAADGQTCSIATHGPLSQASNTPWVSIDQQDAMTECASLGKGYHLITNDEWMTIGANIANVGSNWDGGTVGTNDMTRGHSDNDPAEACAANASDANAYVATNCNGSSTGTFNQRRTFTLSNSEVIWDFAGNVWEWTSYFNDDEKPSDDGTPEADWEEYSLPLVATSTMPTSDLIPTNAVKSFWSNSWNSTQSIGQFLPGIDSSGGALDRGGHWNDTSNAGMFAARLSIAVTDNTNTNIGFRCAVAVP